MRRLRNLNSTALDWAGILGTPYVGVPAEQVPSSGENGAAIAYAWLEFPDDAGKDVRVLITTQPEYGTLYVYDDSSFTYSGGNATAEAQLYLDGVAVGTPQTVTFTTTGEVAVGISGSLSATESGADTFAASGSVNVSGPDQITGTLSAQEVGADTAAIIGDNQITGTLAALESGADTAVIVGTVLIVGSLSVTESGADTLSASGSVLINGSLSVVEQGMDTAIINGGIYQTGYFVAQESNRDSLISYGEISQSSESNTPTSFNGLFRHVQVRPTASLISLNNKQI